GLPAGAEGVRSEHDGHRDHHARAAGVGAGDPEVHLPRLQEPPDAAGGVMRGFPIVPVAAGPGGTVSIPFTGGRRGHPPSVPPQCPPGPPTPAPQRVPVLVDSFYGDLPPNEAIFLRREGRVAFSGSARIDDGTGDLVRITVPTGQTLIVTAVGFYA